MDKFIPGILSRPGAASLFNPVTGMLAGLAAANATAQQQVDARIQAMREEAKFHVERRISAAEQHQMEEEIKEALSVNRSRDSESLSRIVDSSDSHIEPIDFNVDDEADIDDENAQLLQELARPDLEPEIRDAIIIDAVARQDISDQLIEHIEAVQGRGVDERQRIDILQIARDIPIDVIRRYIDTGAQIGSILSTLVIMIDRMRRNGIARSDLKSIQKRRPHDIDTYVPGEDLIGEPVPSHCRRVLWRDEFNRLRSKLICGNIADADGQRVYYNN